MEEGGTPIRPADISSGGSPNSVVDVRAVKAIKMVGKLVQDLGMEPIMGVTAKTLEQVAARACSRQL